MMLHQTPIAPPAPPPAGLLDERAIAAAISAGEGRQVIGIERVSDEWQRLMSEILRIRVRFEDGSAQYIVKKPARSAENRFRSQLDAEAVFQGDDWVVPTGPVFIPEAGLIVSHFIDGASFQQDFALGGLERPALWSQRLDARVRAAGVWLRRLHLHGMKARCDESLMPYLEKRRARFAGLAEPMKERLWALARAPLVGPSATIHGDFCPHNILFSGDRISVIDCGLEEWTYFSPYWDAACFVVAVEEIGRFSIRSPLYWLPRKRERLLRRFFEAYGVDPRGHPDYLKCLAIRHLTYAVDNGAPARTKRGAWHMRRLGKALDLAFR